MRCTLGLLKRKGLTLNIYLHVEISARELDSKLLLAVVAAARGHRVLVSDLRSIVHGANSGRLPPGIFHTKSLTPTSQKITRHAKLTNKGFVITSIDEEGGLIDYGYDKFARERYSEESIDQASAVFCWGADDAKTLKFLYPHQAEKIHETGSPRADLWRPLFVDFWERPKDAPKKPFLLVSSNFSANSVRPLDHTIDLWRQTGMLERNPGTIVELLEKYSEDYRMMSAFVQGIEQLAKHNIGYDVVLRPHPVERIELWRELLRGIPNVHVIRHGSITAWVNHAFAVMHNGCTTAIEAAVSGTPVVTYVPFTQDHARQLPNDLGHRAESPADLLKTVNKLFNQSQSNEGEEVERDSVEQVKEKICFDGAESAAEKMVAIWESLDNLNLSRPSRLRALQLASKLANLYSKIGGAFRGAARARNVPSPENLKFPPMNRSDVRNRINRLRQILGLNQELEVKFLSDNTVLVEKSGQ